MLKIGASSKAQPDMSKPLLPEESLFFSGSLEPLEKWLVSISAMPNKANSQPNGKTQIEITALTANSVNANKNDHMSIPWVTLNWFNFSKCKGTR